MIIKALKYTGDLCPYTAEELMRAAKLNNMKHETHILTRPEFRTKVVEQMNNDEMSLYFRTNTNTRQFRNLQELLQTQTEMDMLDMLHGWIIVYGYAFIVADPIKSFEQSLEHLKSYVKDLDEIKAIIKETHD